MSALGVVRNVGVGNADARENNALQPFHFLGVIVRFVIVTKQMQKAMDRQVGDMIAQRFSLGGGLPGRSLVGNRDIADGASGTRLRVGATSGELLVMLTPINPCRAARSAYQPAMP